jgi:uncharacterized protein (TIGR02271 family)
MGRRGRPLEAEVSDNDAETVRCEEELRVGTQQIAAGQLRLRKHVDEERVEQVTPRGIEHADVEHIAASDGDSGGIETLPDGSVSIPVFEEQLVITKRLVVRERIIVRKHTVTEQHAVEATLRKERVEVDPDDGVADRVRVDTSDGGTAPAAAERDRPRSRRSRTSQK